jgi:hypothetical protein
MAIEIADLPIQNGGFPWLYMLVYQRVDHTSIAIQIGKRPKL